MAGEVTYRRVEATDGDRDIGGAVEFFYERHDAFRSDLINRVDRLTLRSLSRIRMVVMALYVMAVFSTAPVYAQFQEVGNSLCDSGFGQVLAVVFSIAALIYLIKFIFKVMSALDKHKSANSGTHEEGVQKLESAGTTLMAAFVPVAAIVFFELIGISSVSCFEFELGLLGGGGGA